MRLLDRHVLLTGATGTIGRHLAAQLVARGARVTLVARTADPLAALGQALGAEALPADLTDPGAHAGVVAAAEHRSGPVDVVVHNAAVETVGRLDELDDGDVERTVALNLTAPLSLTRLLLPGMLARGSGHVVMLSSLAGVATFPGLAVYGATKAGLTHATAALRIELRGTGVGTTVAEVGPVASAMMDRARRHPVSGFSFARAQRLGALRDLDPHDVARSVLDAVEAERPSVRLPRRVAPLAAVSALPRDLVRVVLSGAPSREPMPAPHDALDPTGSDR
jgi:short-subunit dehydrogenase